MGFLGWSFKRSGDLPPEAIESTVIEEPREKKEEPILYGPRGEPISSRTEAPRVRDEIDEYVEKGMKEEPEEPGESEEQIRARERAKREADKREREKIEKEKKAEELVRDIAKLEARAIKAEEERRFRRAGGTWYQKVVRGAAAGRAMGTEVSKYASAAYRIGTLGGPVKMRPEVAGFYSSKSMRPLTGVESIKGMRTLTSPGGQAPTIDAQRLFSMVNPASMRGTRISRMVQPSTGLRIPPGVSPIAPRQQGQTKIGQVALLAGQKMLGMGQSQLPKAEQEVLTEINRRGGAEVPSQITQSLTSMGLSSPAVQNAIRSLIQKRVIRDSGERFGNEPVLEVVRR